MTNEKHKQEIKSCLDEIIEKRKKWNGNWLEGLDVLIDKESLVLNIKGYLLPRIRQVGEGKFTVEQIGDKSLLQAVHDYTKEIALDVKKKHSVDEFFKFLKAQKNIAYRIILPCYSFSLEENEMWEIVSEHLKIVSADFLDKNFKFNDFIHTNLPLAKRECSYYFIVDIMSSKDLIKVRCEDKIYLFSSLFRLFYSKSFLKGEEWIYHNQKSGKLDIPYNKSRFVEIFYFIKEHDLSYMMNNDSLALYTINKEMIVHFIKGIFPFILKRFFNEIDKKVEKQSKTVLNRVVRALIWMSKARMSEDMPTRFLLFFTAIEAILSTKKDTTNLISRFCVIIMVESFDNLSLEKRYEYFKNMKKLYDKRSRVVHDGNTNIGKKDIEDIQKIAECLIWNIVNNIDILDVKHDKFIQSLKERSDKFSWKI